MRAEFLTALQLSLSTRDGEPFFSLTRRLGLMQPAETSGTADSQVARDGIVAGPLVIPRNVLDWRLDPASEHRHPRRRSVITSS